MKLPFTKANRTSFIEKLNGLDVVAANRFLDGIQEGEEMELVIRCKVKWDIDKMNRYFHGPVCQFVNSQIRDAVGESYSKDEIKIYLKERFLGKDKYGFVYSIKSLEDKDLHPEGPFDAWKDFLNHINAWTIDKFGLPLPESEE